MPIDWKQVDTVFQKALAQPADMRDTWLRDTCGDDAALLAEVRSLLQAHASSDDFLEQPAAAQLEQSELASWTGRMVGPWRIISKLGEGGLGVVFLARRDDGQYQKDAAVKVVRAGLDMEAIRIRFRKERQALATIVHPRVPKLLDGGITENGQPYLVMEYVGGKTLEETFSSADADRETCIRLLEQITEAVRYLHSQLMVHADLKPANVLVTQEGEARLLDFGSTAWLSPDVESSGVTHLILTPAYASPEQKRGEHARPSCDIFAIGRILQRLLEQFPQPVDEDLAAIAAKATQELPEDRYLTAHELLQDFERRRGSMPVLARHQTLGYRVNKFLRRRKVESAAAVVALFAVFGGALAAGIGYTKAKEAEAVATQEAASANQISKFLIRLFEISDPDKAKGKVITAKDLLDQGTKRIGDELKNEPQLQANLMVTLGEVQNKLGDYPESTRLLQDALQKGFAPNRAGDLRKATALGVMGNTLMRAGKHDEAKVRLQEALQLRQRHLGENHGDVAAVYTALGYVAYSQEKLDDALQIQQKALQIRLARVGLPNSETAPIDVAMARRNIGMVLAAQHKTKEALEMFNTALPQYEIDYANQSRLADILDDVAVAKQTLGDHQAALAPMQRAMAIRKTVYAPDNPTLAYSFQNLGRLLTKLGRFDEGITMMEEAVRIRTKALGPDHAFVGITKMLLGGAQTEGGKPGAVATLESGLQILQAKFEPNHETIVRTRRSLADALIQAGKFDAAIPHLQAVIRQSEHTDLRPDLADKSFNPVRKHPMFATLVAEAAKAAPGK